MTRNSRMRVHPQELRFTQNSIAPRFQDGRDIRTAVSDLKAERLHPDDFPILNVVMDDLGRLWSLDNRRLWVFQQAQVAGVNVLLVARGNKAAVEKLKGRGRDAAILQKGHPPTPRVRGPSIDRGVPIPAPASIRSQRRQEQQNNRSYVGRLEPRDDNHWGLKVLRIALAGFVTAYKYFTE